MAKVRSGAGPPPAKAGREGQHRGADSLERSLLYASVSPDHHRAPIRERVSGPASPVNKIKLSDDKLILQSEQFQCDFIEHMVRSNSHSHAQYVDEQMSESDLDSILKPEDVISPGGLSLSTELVPNFGEDDFCEFLESMSPGKKMTQYTPRGSPTRIRASSSPVFDRVRSRSISTGNVQHLQVSAGPLDVLPASMMNITKTMSPGVVSNAASGLSERSRSTSKSISVDSRASRSSAFERSRSNSVTTLDDARAEYKRWKFSKGFAAPTEKSLNRQEATAVSTMQRSASVTGIGLDSRSNTSRSLSLSSASRSVSIHALAQSMSVSDIGSSSAINSHTNTTSASISMSNSAFTTSTIQDNVKFMDSMRIRESESAAVDQRYRRTRKL